MEVEGEQAYLTASFAPCKKVCCLLLTQSSSPMSSSSLHAASCFSSSLSQVVVRGKSGIMKKANKATKTCAN
jgi:hypothetical protein